MCFACQPYCKTCDYHWRASRPDYVSKLCNDCAVAADPWDEPHWDEHFQGFASGTHFVITLDGRTLQVSDELLNDDSFTMIHTITV